MSIRIFSRRVTLASAAAFVLLAACEPGRVAQPHPAPAPAEQAAAAAATLGVAPAAVAGPTTVLSAHVEGWNVPAVSSTALPPAALPAEVAARGQALEQQIRAHAAQADTDPAPR